ncbi:MAG: large-conductance mechanosensitive channel protein MscL [Prevotella sp.]|nr:large-conductance mechanosensitive channel protein MscL [Prevotella sp.]
MAKLVQEFKDFAMRGNVIDMAVGVIIGGAFGKIVSSLVDDMLMPLIGTLTGGINFTELSVNVGDAQIKYGMFLQNILDFIIVAFCVFMMIKGINNLAKKKKEEEAAAPEVPAEPSAEEKLLTEIRDLLKEKK